MTELIIEKAHEVVARHRWAKLTFFMEKINSKMRRYTATDGKTYRIVYSLDRHIGWDAQLMVNNETVCRFEYPARWFTTMYAATIRDARNNPIKDERVFISEFHEFIEDYREEE